MEDQELTDYNNRLQREITEEEQGSFYKSLSEKDQHKYKAFNTFLKAINQ